MMINRHVKSMIHMVCILTLTTFSNLVAQIDTLKQENNNVSKKFQLYADSLEMCFSENKLLKTNVQQLSSEINNLKAQLNVLSEEEKKLSNHNEELQNKINELDIAIDAKNQLLQDQIHLLEEKERIFINQVQLYKEAIFSSKLDSVEFTGKIQAINVELDGKKNEINMLKDGITEKNTLIETKNSELNKLRQKSEAYQNQVNDLKDTLSGFLLKITTQKKDLEYTKNQLTDAKKQINKLKKQLHECNNRGKKKKIRLVQGVSIVNFRTPVYELAPKDVNNPNTYVIHNKNSGDIEIDYITGTSVKIIDLSEKDAKFTSDLGVFVGIGGKELFKNLYIGGNIKLFNVFHINTGVNLREYEILKEGFALGDPLDTSSSIPTTNEWKLNFYAGLTFDFDLIAQIAKKL